MPAPPRETIKKFYEDNFEVSSAVLQDTMLIREQEYYAEMSDEYKENLDYEISILETYVETLQKQIDIIE